MEKNNFYEVLKLLYENVQIIDDENGQALDIVNALHVYQIVEMEIPRLLKGYHLEQGWVVSDTNKMQAKRLITALKKVKNFPRPNLKDINRKVFSELGQFLEFVESIHYKRTIKRKYSDIVLVDKSSGIWTLNEEDHAEMFLKAYLDYRYKKQIESSPFDQEQDAITQLWGECQNEKLEKFALGLKEDIALELKKARALFVIATKITILKPDQQPPSFTELIVDKIDLLNILRCNENIVRIVYRPLIKSKETLVYYAVFFMQSVFDFNEKSLTLNIKEVLKKQFTSIFGVSVVVDVGYLNPILLSKNIKPTPPLREFLLVEGVKECWEVVEQKLLGLLYQIEKLGEFNSSASMGVNNYLSSIITSNRRAIQLKANTCNIEHQLTYVKANHVQENIFSLLFLSTGERSKNIWEIKHLSDNAREYISRIIVIYQENFTVWKMQKHLELAIHIEIFMMTLMESAPDAFYFFTANARNALNKNIENFVSRQLLQFTEIFRNQFQLNGMQSQLKGKVISHTLEYFLHIYTRQLCDQGDAVVLERILVADIKERRIQKLLDNLLCQFRLTRPLFFKAEPRPKLQKKLSEKKRIRLYAQIVQPSSMQSIIPSNYHSQNSTSSLQVATQPYVEDRNLRIFDEYGVDTSHKLIHIQRHKSRFEKVQKMLISAMKTDVVIIRCLFYCDANKEMDYSYFSKIFSTMLQDNKKRKPISDIAMYLGYWEGRTRVNKKKITSYAANVVLLFKSQVLLEYPNLFAELERSWCLACGKIERNLDPEISINGKVDKLQIAQTLSQLQCYQLLLETTQKTLAKSIVKHLAGYIVYQDLLDDEIYQQLPKWLIKKTGTTIKTKAVTIGKRKKVQT